MVDLSRLVDWISGCVKNLYILDNTDIFTLITRRANKVALKRKSSAPKKEAVLKAVKLKHLKNDSNYDSQCGNPGFCFAPASSPKKGVITQIKVLSGCREGFMSRYRDAILDDNSAYRKKTSVIVWINKGKTEYAKLPSGGAGPDTHEAWMEKSCRAGLHLINHFEKRNKWLLTKLYRVDHTIGKKHIIYYFQGSRWWQFAPHSMSLFMLLIRLGKREDIQNLRANASTKTILETIGSVKTDNNDHNYTRQAERWLPFLDNRRAIYKGRSLEQNWKICSSSSDGIQMLTSGRSMDKTTQMIFNEFCAKAGV